MLSEYNISGLKFLKIWGKAAVKVAKVFSVDLSKVRMGAVEAASALWTRILKLK